VPDEGAGFRKVDALLVALRIVEAKLDALGNFGEDGEVRSDAVPGGAERVGCSWPDTHV
jgi:hypothetical protein